jgi:SAM-dependent methyltransferase
MNTPCLCGGTSYESILGGTSAAGPGTTSRGFSVARCRACGLARTDPPPYVSDLDATVYQEASYAGPFEEPLLWRSFFDPLLDAAERHGKGGRLLDVGCGPGFLVKMAAERGFDSCGVELNREAARYGQESHGLEILPTDLKGAGFPDGHFEVVVLSQVLEHITAPATLLAEIRRVLSPGGVLVVDSPNMGGLLVPLWGARWSGFQPQWHVWQFTPRTLGALLEREGFEVLESTCRQSIHVGKPNHALKRLVLAPAYRAGEAFAELINRGDKVLVVARGKSRNRE